MNDLKELERQRAEIDRKIAEAAVDHMIVALSAKALVQVACDVCDGTGEYRDPEPDDAEIERCPFCDGDGWAWALLWDGKREYHLDDAITYRAASPAPAPGDREVRR